MGLLTLVGVLLWAYMIVSLRSQTAEVIYGGDHTERDKERETAKRLRVGELSNAVWSHYVPNPRVNVVVYPARDTNHLDYLNTLVSIMEREPINIFVVRYLPFYNIEMSTWLRWESMCDNIGEKIQLDINMSLPLYIYGVGVGCAAASCWVAAASTATDGTLGPIGDESFKNRLNISGIFLENPWRHALSNTGLSPNSYHAQYKIVEYLRDYTGRIYVLSYQGNANRDPWRLYKQLKSARKKYKPYISDYFWSARKRWLLKQLGVSKPKLQVRLTLITKEIVTAPSRLNTECPPLECPLVEVCDCSDCGDMNKTQDGFVPVAYL